jgi:glucosamine 6-phosphate synthetase-like amidotransferase/phosphosugar isomerase protein
VKPDAFLADLRRKPEVLAALASRLGDGNPWDVLVDRPDRVVLLGMGSSMYAASVAAARLRSRGLVAVAELASTDLLPRWGARTLVVAISAGGKSKETLDALGRVHPDAMTVALTNVPGSPVSGLCAVTVEMGAEAEEGRVSCRSFQHTIILLLALEAHLLDEPLDDLISVIDRVAEASAYLLSSETAWRPDVTRLLDGPAGSHLAAPARRLSSAQQGALMLREGPCRAAVACEAGDWAHVDEYLTKNADYRLLLFAGSSWDAGILALTLPRKTVVVSVGGSLDGAAFTLRYPHDDVDDVRLLTEVLVVELVAARLWAEQEVGAG